MLPLSVLWCGARACPVAGVLNIQSSLLLLFYADAQLLSSARVHVCPCHEVPCVFQSVPLVKGGSHYTVSFVFCMCLSFLHGVRNKKACNMQMPCSMWQLVHKLHENPTFCCRPGCADCPAQFPVKPTPVGLLCMNFPDDGSAHNIWHSCTVQHAETMYRNRICAHAENAAQRLLLANRCRFLRRHMPQGLTRTGPA